MIRNDLQRGKICGKIFFAATVFAVIVSFWAMPAWAAKADNLVKDSIEVLKEM